MAERMSSVEMQLIKKAMQESVFEYVPSFAAITKIRNFWNDNLEEPDITLTYLEDLLEVKDKNSLEDKSHSDEIPAAAYSDSEICYDLDLSDLEMIDEEKGVKWLIGLSSEFIKSVKKIDKKLKGRILDAIEILSTDPVSAKGDTIKPLKNELAGLWRYRVGDFRLVYRPDNKHKQVTLLIFDSRGSVYS